ncbi:sensor domain-containing diguanylate cyclase [Pseudomaricurvus sp. HS19]|uniref:sensor domain-containing diguanylate cyclase n=1 Tax=Pseudomaricurvus sp. HS19 TaxID=2692626 RepID=UPI00136E7033|nr:sensor domain-containing diguanylate cyclase [Pseudomaricurvus sp. HS19]MYM61776.1 diguanylate cyclase [Pseudomaricurvus sp. HS19]
MLELTSDGIWDWNALTGYVYRSPGWFRMLGYEPNELAGTVLTWEAVIHPDDYDQVMELFDDYVQGRSSEYHIQYRCITKKGGEIWVEDRGFIVARDEHDQVARMIGAQRDISAEKRLLQQSAQKNLSLHKMVERRTRVLRNRNKQLATKVKEVENIAIHDSLTGLYNRHHFDEKLKTECARASRFDEPLSLLAIDIDNLKPINDQYGHSIGDMALVWVASTLRDNVREIDVPVRWGGDEFMLLLPNTSLDQAGILAEKLQQRVSLLTLESELPTSVSISIGAAQLRSNEGPQELLDRADSALYKAKHNGGGQVSQAWDNIAEQ